MERERRQRLWMIAALICCAVILSWMTVILQAAKVGYEHLVEGGIQLQRHRDVLEGTAESPWQYRVLSEYLVAGVLRLFARSGLPNASVAAFLLFRLVQNVAIFLLAWTYLRQLGLSPSAGFVGIAVLAWSMTHALYESDLSFNTYFDVIFYLLAGLLILRERCAWIVPLTLVAALNRETSGLIPWMLFGVGLAQRGTARRRAWILAAVAMAVYTAVFFGVRWALGPRPLFIPHGQHPGLQLLGYNLGRQLTWLMLVATLGPVPFVAVAAMRRWPEHLRAFFWAVVPVWLVVHAFNSVLAETRLLLVPQALIFIPGALFAVARAKDSVLDVG